MKASKYILRILLCSILIFSMLIGDAYSYQEAKTQTSENTYTFGDVSATLNNVELITHRNDHLLYPSQFFEVQPEIANTGSSDIWTILAIKVSSINVPYANESSRENFEEPTAIIDRDTYIPSFYPIKPESRYVWKEGYKEYWYLNNYGNHSLDYYEENNSTLAPMGIYSKWELLYIDEKYSQTEGGFFVYYLGYKDKLEPNQVAPTPFDAIMTANVTRSSVSYFGYLENTQFISYEDLCNSNYHADTDIFDKNMNISLKLFAIQADYNEKITDIQGAYNYLNEKNELFGNNTIVSATIDTGVNENNKLKTYTHVTDDIHHIVIKSESGYSSDIINTSNPDENGLISIYQELPFNSTHTNTHYYVEAYDADNNLVDTTEMGWVS